MKPEEIWDATLSELAIQVPRPSFVTWLSGTTGTDFTGDEFVVEVPNAFVAQMLDERMYSLIMQALDRILGEPVDVRFEIAGTVETAVPGVQPLLSAPAEPSTFSPQLSFRVSTKNKRLRALVDTVGNWLNDQCSVGRFPGAWRGNIRKFLDNQVKACPDILAWNWLVKTLKLFDISKPFGWIKKVLEEPWGALWLADHQIKMELVDGAESLDEVHEAKNTFTVLKERDAWAENGNLDGFYASYGDDLRKTLEPLAARRDADAAAFEDLKDLGSRILSVVAMNQNPQSLDPLDPFIKKGGDLTMSERPSYY